MLLKAAQGVRLWKQSVSDQHTRRTVLKVSDVGDDVRHYACKMDERKGMLRRETRVRERREGELHVRNSQSASKAVAQQDGAQYGKGP